MRTAFVVSRLTSTLLIILLAGVIAWAQRPPGAPLPGQRRIDSGGRLPPRPGRPQNAVPGGRRALGGELQLGRPKDRLRTPEERRRMQQQLMQAIGLTDEQRARMDAIRRSHDDEIISAGRRLREARRSFDRAIMNDQYDEALINQRADELAQAQADMIRLQARIRGQVRSVMSPEQIVRFNMIERRLRRQQREQQDVDKDGSPRNQGPQPPPGEAGEAGLVGLLLDLP